jgi:anti-anti-sigma regulatory factor
MSFVIDFFKIPGKQKGNIRLRKMQQLTGQEATFIRKEIGELMSTEFDTIYVDASDVVKADLSGINEIIHTNYTLQQAAKKLVFVYRKNSVVEKWVETTSLDKFVDTALLPSN